MRFFTTEGPVNPADHYCLPPLARIDMAEIRELIAQKKYFLLHAPRQTGKTSCLLALADLLSTARAPTSASMLTSSPPRPCARMSTARWQSS